jgi:hypothetical protein
MSRGRGKFEQLTVLLVLVVRVVTNVVGSDTGMCAICDWRAWRGPTCQREHIKFKVGIQGGERGGAHKLPGTRTGRTQRL